LNANGLCVCPSINLISNIGDGDQATHTKKDNRVRLEVKNFQNPITHALPELNKRLTFAYEKKMGLTSAITIFRNILEDIRISIKKSAKTFLSFLLIRKKNRIVIASTGRSGSTMLFDAITSAFVKTKISNGLLNKIFLRKLCSGYLNRMHDIDIFSPIILKTHDIIDKKYVDKAKFVFVYGDPLESAQSVDNMVHNKGLVWFEEHQYHLRASGEYKDLYVQDVLNFESQIKAWFGIKSDKVMIIRYDELWDRTDELSEFLGFPIILPARRERSSKILSANYDAKLFARLRRLIATRIG
jgi:hypothetical protein